MITMTTGATLLVLGCMALGLIADSNIGWVKHIPGIVVWWITLTVLFALAARYGPLGLAWGVGIWGLCNVAWFHWRRNKNGST
jgi:hypothetical protein